MTSSIIRIKSLALTLLILSMSTTPMPLAAAAAAEEIPCVDRHQPSEEGWLRIAQANGWEIPREGFIASMGVPHNQRRFMKWGGVVLGLHLTNKYFGSLFDGFGARVWQGVKNTGSWAVNHPAEALVGGIAGVAAVWATYRGSLKTLGQIKDEFEKTKSPDAVPYDFNMQLWPQARDINSNAAAVCDALAGWRIEGDPDNVQPFGAIRTRMEAKVKCLDALLKELESNFIPAHEMQADFKQMYGSDYEGFIATHGVDFYITCADARPALPNERWTPEDYFHWRFKKWISPGVSFKLKTLWDSFRLHGLVFNDAVDLYAKIFSAKMRLKAFLYVSRNLARNDNGQLIFPRPNQYVDARARDWAGPRRPAA